MASLTQDMNLDKLWKIMRDSKTWHAAAVLGVAKSQTQLGNRTTTTESAGKRAAPEASHSRSGESKCMSSCSLQVTWPIAACFVTGLQWAIPHWISLRQTCTSPQMRLPISSVVLLRFSLPETGLFLPLN